MAYTLPVLFVLLYNFLVFILDFPRFRETSEGTHALGLSCLFFFSGMPALIYQIVWQRALFAIYGVNAESVAVVVSALMLGLAGSSCANPAANIPTRCLCGRRTCPVSPGRLYWALRLRAQNRCFICG